MDKVIKEKFKALNKALELQAKEYKRRLKTLNHENERIKEVQKDSIPREVFERVIGDIKKTSEERLGNLLDKITELINYKTKQEGRSQLLQYIPWLIAIVAILASWYKK